MTNVIYNNNNGALVTDSVFQIGGSTYQLRNINSMRTVCEKVPKKRRIIGTIALHFFITLPIIGGAVGKMFESGIPSSIAGVSILGYAGYKSWKIAKEPTYLYKLILSTSSGEQEAVWSHDDQDIISLENALNQALSLRAVA